MAGVRLQITVQSGNDRLQDIVESLRIRQILL